MKIILYLFIPAIAFASPSWLYNISHTKNDIVGYGISKDLREAKNSAIEEISHCLHVSVDSSLSMSTIDKDAIVKQSSSASLKTNSKVVLSGVEFIKLENDAGLWYVAAMYDNSSLDIKLKKLLSKKLQNETQNKYLTKSPLILDLNKELGIRLNYKIVRKDNLWQLKYKDILLPINMKNFYKLFSNQNNPNLSIVSNKNIYKENDEMYFTVTQKNKGYISILYVEHNGKVGVLLVNKKSNKSFTFPDSEEESFKIANPYAKAIKELYVVLYSSNPIDLNKFENISEDLLDESNYNFDKLLSKFNEIEYSTYEIKIRK